jgi:hypothetical protein
MGGGAGVSSGVSAQMTRARSCCRSGVRPWIAGTHSDQRRMKGTKVAGQLASESVRRGEDFPALPVRGRGTEGGLVVQRSAAKKRHSAGPGPRW